MAASPYAWSALGGLALATSFPKFGMAGLAWVAPGWILLAGLGRRSGEAFRIGYVGGLIYALAAFYWLLWIPFPAGAIAGWLALSAYLGLYMGFWVWLCWGVFPGQGRSRIGGTRPFGPGSEGTGVPVEKRREARAASSLRGTAENYFAVALPRRVVWAFGCAVVWVALEMVLARLFTGFPWNLLGVSQYRVLPLIQIAPFTGVYGVSFLLVWFSVSLASATLRLLLDPAKPKGWVGDLILPLVVLLVVIAFGSSELAKARAPERTLKAVLIQPSIPQTLIWDTNRNTLRFKQLIELSQRALNEMTNAQLLVWPEAAVPNMLRYEFEVYQAVTNLTSTHHIWMILGSDDAIPRPGSTRREFDFFNSCFLVTPRGEIAATYRKRRLVIFGEYIPLERWLPLMKYLTPVGGSFAAGEKPVSFQIPELSTKTSVLICFEDIFPHYGREYVETDTDFLLNLTNNGWFGESAAQWQHAANAVFRAVENRIPLVRCANNGLTCWVDSYGSIQDIFFDALGSVYGGGFKAVDIPLLAAGQKRDLTFYTRHGDWFGWSCVGVTGIQLVWMIGKRCRRRRPSGAA